MSDEDARGRFIWYELLTSDPGAAMDFYKQIIGWGTQAFDGAGVPYNTWMVGETPIGGVMQLPEEAVAEGARPHWLPYVAVPDVDQSVARATELGANTYVQPTDIAEIGRFAVMGDPQGAIFAVYKPLGDTPAHDSPPKQGEFSWHELMTTDYEAAFSFYSDLFGWEKTENFDMGEAGIYQMYGRKGMPLGGMFNKTAEIQAPPHWMLYIRVSDVDALVEGIKDAGGQILTGPMEVPGGSRIAQCLDPQGAAFAIDSQSNA